MSLGTKIKYAFMALITGVGFVVFFATLGTVLHSGDIDSVDVPIVQSVQQSNTSESAITNSPLPYRLAIPALGIDAAVQHVGVNQKGNMANPNNFKDVGWYKYGPKPGDTGAAVIAGHYDNGLGMAGVFKKLTDVRSGDDIYVLDKQGSRLHFKVKSTRVYDYKNAEATKEVFTAASGKSELKLITCSGSWIKAANTYSERTVVIAELYSGS